MADVGPQRHEGGGGECFKPRVHWRFLRATAAGPHFKPDESCAHHHTQFNSKIRFNVSLINVQVLQLKCRR
jgi:hypothetical protein